jgi:hypothetical protein
MVERRNLVGGGLAAGLTALVAGTGEAEAAAQAQQVNTAEISREVRELRQTIEGNFNRPWVRIAQIREQQRIWIRANHRYPDFIEVGIEIWDALHDWHVRYQQPISMQRAADGRYLMSFMFTTFILRPDTAPDYVGPPFDQSERRPAV